MKRIVLFAALIATPALAQQAAPPPSEQALGAKLMREVQDGLQCNVSLITLQIKIKELEAKLKDQK